MEAIIFDFDGVLVDSEPLHEWSIREAVAPLGWTFTHEQFVAGIVGRGDERAFSTIAAWNHALTTPSLNPAQNKELAESLLKHKRARMSEGIAAGRYTVQPHAAEVVVLAASRFPLAVCSGSRASVVRTMLDAIGLAQFFKHIVTADDVTRAKPAPDGYLLASERLRKAPAKCLAIEDTPSGIAAAKNAGMRVVALCHTCPAPMLSDADEVLDQIADMRRLLAER